MNLAFASGFLVPQSILGVDYFRGLPAHFPNALFPTTAIDAHVRDRAKTLATEINRRFPDGEIHIIAHSMGGLDSRYLLSKNLLGLAGRVKSLSTISTPHWGSPVADLVLDLVPGVDSTLVRRALNQFPAVQSGAPMI
ncbi:MAG: alpha/beta fold hydrolase [Candidatus Angelobacter sp.]